MRVLARFAGNPEMRFPSIHVAGTNGKGSTCAFLASIFMEAGYRVGLYTSPHLVRFNERIKINGIEIIDDDIVRYVRILKSVVDSTNATFFEATTCVAFMHFAENDVDIAILETGMGGRLDATNIVRPLISVITNVGYDHTKELGDTLPEIAFEKGGIIKRDVPCVTGSRSSPVLDTLGGVARRRSTTLFEADRIARINNVRNLSDDYNVSISSKHFAVKRASLGFSGLHQIANAQLAIAATELVRQRCGMKYAWVNSRAVASGLSRVRKNTGLHGRLETIRHSRQYVLDVAHNADGMARLVSCLRGKKTSGIAVFGVMADKDYRSMLRLLSTCVRRLVAVAPATARALPAGTVAREAAMFGMRVSRASSVREGIKIAEGDARTGQILITGSHYVVGEALTYLKQFLTKSQ